MAIQQPTLLLDKNKCLANIQRMCAKARKHQLELRPHFKTHQSLEIGRWFKAEGIDKITVSSVSMAQYFADEWNDITIAFPVNILEINKINTLAERITVNLLVESEESISFLSQNLKYPVNIFIKIDVGAHRTGVHPENDTLISKIISIIEASSKLNFMGFLAHAGQTYQCRSREAIKAVHYNSLQIMTKLKSRYQNPQPHLIISLGDTPSCSVAEDFKGLDEMRPGNFVFYDLTQHRIGSSAIAQIALAMACPIVAIHKERCEIVVYGGAVHFSKDRLEGEPEGTIYGRVVEKAAGGWVDIIPGMYVKSLSQEHGIVVVPPDLIKQYRPGDYLLILPVHACLTVHAIKSYTTLEGNEISTL